MSRKWSNIELKKIAHLFTGDIVNVSAGKNIDKQGSTYDLYFSNASKFFITNYKKDSYKGFQGLENEIELDLEQPIEISEIADVVFNHTTLEHIFDVFTAFDNLCKLTKDIVILVTPFVQCQHETNDFKDYWRLTPTAIEKLFERNNMKLIYQSANEAFPGVYVFSVASKHPENWEKLMPEWYKITTAAANIP